MVPLHIGQRRPVHGRNQETHIPVSSIPLRYLQSLKKSIMIGIQLHISDVIPILLGKRSMWLHTKRLSILNTRHILGIDGKASSSRRRHFVAQEECRLHRPIYRTRCFWFPQCTSLVHLVIFPFHVEHLHVTWGRKLSTEFTGRRKNECWPKHVVVRLPIDHPRDEDEAESTARLLGTNARRGGAGPRRGHSFVGGRPDGSMDSKNEERSGCFASLDLARRGFVSERRTGRHQNIALF